MCYCCKSKFNAASKVVFVGQLTAVVCQTLFTEEPTFASRHVSMESSCGQLRRCRRAADVLSVAADPGIVSCSGLSPWSAGPLDRPQPTSLWQHHPHIHTHTQTYVHWHKHMAKWETVNLSQPVSATFPLGKAQLPNCRASSSPSFYL